MVCDAWVCGRWCVECVVSGSGGLIWGTLSFSGLFGLAGWILFSVGSIERDLLICSVVC